MVAVGGHPAEGELAAYSPRLPWVTCTAPGDVVSTFLDGRVRRRQDVVEFGGFARWKGTSIATAVVSGMVAARTEPAPGGVSADRASALLLEEGTTVRRPGRVEVPRGASPRNYHGWVTWRPGATR
ncbi:S8 family serine peptidase [Actinosynnema sp. NPDC023587]|uniref:S8 family serine peptidase n=1 Tax=Actinosynnema sp. NPDC023587 TaxID=3154695 RepID=UPI0033DABA18